MNTFRKRLLGSIVSDLRNKPYEYWETIDFPGTFEITFEGKRVQVN